MNLTKINYMKHSKGLIWFSVALMLACLLSLAVFGLNRGIDFTGGDIYDLQFGPGVTTAQVSGIVTEAVGTNNRVQEAQPKGEDAANVSEFLVRTPQMSAEGRKGLLESLGALGEFKIIGEENVSAAVSKELTEQAALAILIAALLQVIYIWIRFELRFGVAAVIALVHDLVVTLGLMALLQIQINAAFVAAILTVLGYSINDTIIVFDRVRENLDRRLKGESLTDLTTRSIQETILRSLYTSGSTLLVLASLAIFGGDSTRDMAVTLLIGIAAGAYSSITVASAIWLRWRMWDDARRKAAAASRPARA